MGKDALKLKLAGSKMVYMNVSLEEVLEGLRMMEERLRNESETRFEGIQQKLENIENQTEKGFRILESKLGGIERGQADTRHTIVTSASQMQLNLEGTLIKVEDRIKHTVSKGTNSIRKNIDHLQNTTAWELATLNSSLHTAQECMEEVKNKQEDIIRDLSEARADIMAEINSTDKVGNCHESVQPIQYSVDSLTSTIVKKFNLLDDQVSSVSEATLQLVRGWKKVAHLDMRDPTHKCPPGLTERTESGKRECGRTSRGPFMGCTSITYPTHNVEYKQVCGKVIGYHYGYLRAFWAYVYFTDRNLTLEDAYVDGVSITHGNPRKHIWTFAGTWGEGALNHFACPCTHDNPNYSGVIPPFLEDNYFCDTGRQFGEPDLGAVLRPAHPLWDGQECGTGSCCTFNSPPWFCRELPAPTTDDIELRVCRSFNIVNVDTPIEQIQLYIR